MSQGRKLNPYYPFDSELQYLLAKDLFTPTLHPQNDIERVAVHEKYVKGEACFLSLRNVGIELKPAKIWVQPTIAEREYCMLENVGIRPAYRTEVKVANL